MTETYNPIPHSHPRGRCFLVGPIHVFLFCIMLSNCRGMSVQVKASRQNLQQSQRPSLFPSSIPTEPCHIDTFQRQTGQKNPSLAAIGIPATACATCRHGFPQAFAMDPMHAGRINSGLLKLTCPLLVRAVDQLEDDGVMEEWKVDLNNIVAKEMQEGHALHASIRQSMLSPEEIQQVQTKLGPHGAQAFLEAGVAGASPHDGSRMDIKCLHAWLAHAMFFRNPETTTGTETTTTTMSSSVAVSVLGNRIVDELWTRYGVELSGTISCRGMCDPTMCSSLADPPKPRNKQRLRTSKEVERRRKRQKEQREQ